MPDTDDLPLIAYPVTEDAPPAPIEPGPVRRPWMDETVDAFAYQCLPLVMANQVGWELLSPISFAAVWNGGPYESDIEIRCVGEPSPLVETHFGHGILTFKTGYLFRTPPGHNLWVKGPTNRFKDGIAPLEGLVEADWGPFTFTMNWRFTRPGTAIKFERGEPFACVVPFPRDYAQRFAPVIREIDEVPELKAQYVAWRDNRRRFIDEVDVEGSEANASRWQKHYRYGVTPEGSPFPEHERRLPLRPFTRESESR